MKFFKSYTDAREEGTEGPRWGTLILVVLLLSVGVRAEDAACLFDTPYLDPARDERMDIYIPRVSDTQSQVAAVVLFHGGGWVSGDKQQLFRKGYVRLLTDAGFVVAVPNYKLGAGAWPTNLHDCKNAVRYLRQHATKYRINQMQIAVLGESAGAHLALLVAFTSGHPEFEPAGPYPGVSDQVAVAIDISGPTDLTLGDKDSEAGVRASRVFGGGPQDGAGFWLNVSPVSHIRRGAPPVLVIHGKTDPIVPISHALALVQELNKEGVHNRFVALPSPKHGFPLSSRKQGSTERKVAASILEFLAEHITSP